MKKRPAKFKIDVNEKFPRLPNAPIVEAVVQWQATPTHSFEQSALLKELSGRFPNFATQIQHGLEAAFEGSPEGMSLRQRSKWDGVRLTSEDQKHICQFKPNTVAFSRLAPYDGWEGFIKAATPFWLAFLDLAAPTTVEKISVRFISQVILKDGEAVSDFVDGAQSPLANLGIAAESFFHQDSMQIPSYPYRLNLVRTVQVAEPPLFQKTLFVDIDATTTDETPLDSVESRLQDLRFLKNRVFFSFMKDAEAKFA